MQEAREEHRRKAEATEEQRQAMLFAQSEKAATSLQEIGAVEGGSAKSS